MNTVSSTIKSEIKDKRIYAYGNFPLWNTITTTVGLSYQNFEEPFDLSELNPKFGIRWDISPKLVFRATYFETMKPALAGNRTIEPTQIAGFNQFFDDPNATRSTYYGVAADWQPIDNLFLGVQWGRRSLERPEFFNSEVIFEKHHERTQKMYASWTPSERWSIGVQAIYDKFSSAQNSMNFLRLPRELETFSLPVNVKYFHPTGFYAGIGATYVEQSLKRPKQSLLPQGDSKFTLVDFSAGYRLPKRQGMISLSVQNAFDKEFNYQDDSFREFRDEPSVGPYLPERTFMARITLNF